MKSWQEIEMSNSNDDKSALRRSQKALENARKSIERSDKLDVDLQQSVKKTWDCSRQNLNKKMAKIFGEPSERDVFLARKIKEDNLKLMQPGPRVAKKKTFFVNNPI